LISWRLMPSKLERCFKDAREVEERANAAPRDWREREPFAQALDSIKLLTA
jgi:hypothetical protein